jgi:hypothetical protein
MTKQVDKTILLGLSIIGLVIINIVALISIGLLSLFVLAASYPLAEKLLKAIEKSTKDNT